MAAGLLAIVGIRLCEEPAEPDLLVCREEVLAVAAPRRIRRPVGDADRKVSLAPERAVGTDPKK